MNTLIDDAPFGSINCCTISFLTPQKIEKIKHFDVQGFKVHNGYNTLELANIDAKKIKEKKKEHDVYMSELGKIYGWDDATKADMIEYDNEKLNELEKTRRENIDKFKLMAEQFKTENETLHTNMNSERKDKITKRMQQKLYEKGLITQKEYEMIQDEHKPTKEIKSEAAHREKIDAEVEECYQTDYLDENEPVALKYGCISIFSPKHIKGLSLLCFKIRGLFETMTENEARINELKERYPKDRIYRFEIGKWCGYSENDNMDPLLLLKQLNYAMKCYLDNMEHEKEEFEKRKNQMQSQTEQESKITQAKNRQAKRKEKREAKNKQTKEATKPIEPITPAPSVGTTDDDAAIQNILNFLDDPETRNKFPADKETIQTVAVDVK